MADPTCCPPLLAPCSLPARQPAPSSAARSRLTKRGRATSRRQPPVAPLGRAHLDGFALFANHSPDHAPARAGPGVSSRATGAAAGAPGSKWASDARAKWACRGQMDWGGPGVRAWAPAGPRMHPTQAPPRHKQLLGRWAGPHLGHSMTATLRPLARPWSPAATSIAAARGRLSCGRWPVVRAGGLAGGASRGRRCSQFSRSLRPPAALLCPSIRLSVVVDVVRSI